jgi:deoxyribonuclease V
MIVAIDSYYYSDTDCYTVGVLFSKWEQSKPSRIISCHTSEFAPYCPGKFYTRELPGILNLMKRKEVEGIDTIVLDSFLSLKDNDGSIKEGLGCHLREYFPSISLIGVAKSEYCLSRDISIPVIRGLARNPLWVQGMGEYNNSLAASCIKSMFGDYRIPDLLKILDKETKKYR